MKKSLTTFLKTSVLLSSILCLSVSVHATSNVLSTVKNYPGVGTNDFITTLGSGSKDGSFYLATFVDYAYQSLEVSQNGERLQGIIDHLLVQHFLAGFSPSAKWELEIDVPIIYYAQFREPTTLNAPSQNVTSMGDILVRSRFHLRDAQTQTFGLSLVPYVTLPTGDSTHFLGQNSFSFGMLAAVDFKISPVFRIGFNAGMEFFEKIELIDYNSGSSIKTGLAVAITPTDFFTIKLDLNAATSPHDFFTKVSSPVEVLGAVDFKISEHIAVTAGGGYPLVRGAAIPKYRTFFGLSYRY